MITCLRQKTLLNAYGLHKHLQIHRAAWQKKGKVETDGNTTFYMSGGLCPASGRVKPMLAGKTRKGAPLPKASCLHPSSTHFLSSTRSLRGPETISAASPLAWYQYAELLQWQLFCLLALCFSHVQAHLLPDGVCCPSSVILIWKEGDQALSIYQLFYRAQAFLGFSSGTHYSRTL